jgi:acid phosphatase
MSLRLRSTFAWPILLLAGGCMGRHAAPSAPVAPAAASSGPAATPAPTPTPLRDTHESLQGVLWMQTSAEYQVLARTAYAAATATLDRALADPSWTAALEQEGGHYADLPPAVILDLDETVLDNSPFQGQLVLGRTVYTPDLWAKWVDKAAAQAVPGAAEFVDAARRRDVHVFFVTNRKAKEEARTIVNLDALLAAKTDAGDVLCVEEQGWDRNKSARRKFVAATHRILMLVGDDLNDFLSPSAVPAERVALAQEHTAWWGDRWVLIPNPVYGNWDQILYPGLKDDAAILAKKREVVKGFAP